MRTHTHTHTSGLSSYFLASGPVQLTAPHFSFTPNPMVCKPRQQSPCANVCILRLWWALREHFGNARRKLGTHARHRVRQAHLECSGPDHPRALAPIRECERLIKLWPRIGTEWAPQVRFIFSLSQVAHLPRPFRCEATTAINVSVCVGLHLEPFHNQSHSLNQADRVVLEDKLSRHGQNRFVAALCALLLRFWRRPETEPNGALPPQSVHEQLDARFHWSARALQAALRLVWQ
mmetsp:Transcript_25428/g.80910  ORF Transcript_25428/g.80910 Transcript_25428/m.80910 type:complete len:234 (+) Transcript_25428:331-1032(+)